jgi:hypothetical protein
MMGIGLFMSRMIDLSKRRFHRLLVIRQAPNDGKFVKWTCVCDCGTKKDIRSGALLSGKIKSCGCLNREKAKARLTTHGMIDTPEYRAWKSLKQRCRNHPNYKSRGITVSERWKKFETFLSDMGLRPSDSHSIERKKNHKGYSRENCFWGTRAQQNNNRRNNIYITFKRKTLTATQWGNKLGMRGHRIACRVRNGWPAKFALNPNLTWEQIRIISARYKPVSS